MKLKSLIQLIVMILFVGNISFAQSAKYVGVAKCKMCHNKSTTGAQYKVWAASKHANAYKVLKDADKKNPKCLKCHSTAAGADKTLLTETITKEEGVSCESCHGPGSLYKTTSVMRNVEAAKKKGLVIPSEKVCVKCHNSESPNFKGFNYKEYYAKIKHPNPAK